MAKQAEDLKTIDLLPAPTKRGRPESGKAMTATQRKKAQRARDEELIWGSDELTAERLEQVSMDGLLNCLAECVRKCYMGVFDQVTNELRRRALVPRD